MGGQTAEYAATYRLLDGRLASLRRLSADDAEAVAALHQNLDDRDRYLRFFTLSSAHLAQLVKELTEPGVGQCAVGAFDGDRLIGVANYAASTDPLVADMAVVVAHKEHSRGVGTALLRYLAEIASSQGIRRFAADVLAENQLMFQVLFDFGWPRTRLSYGPISHMEFELPDCGPSDLTGVAEHPSQGVRDV
jgi:GNAT superfamily N-acetyltransferase